MLRVRVTGFPRRAVAALCDLALLFAATLAVTATVAMGLHVPMPGLREVGPDLLVAGILDRNPMAVGAVGLLLGLAGLYQLYFAGMAGQTLGMRLAAFGSSTGAAVRPGRPAGCFAWWPWLPVWGRRRWAGCGPCSIASTAPSTITWPART